VPSMANGGAGFESFARANPSLRVRVRWPAGRFGVAKSRLCFGILCNLFLRVSMLVEFPVAMFPAAVQRSIDSSGYKRL
jgi:hypothetical protein